MQSLLKSDFGRLFKNKFFYVLLVVTFIGSMYSEIATWSDPDCTCAEFGTGDFWIFILIFVAMIIPMFVCTDFSSGMIRNKITVGHSRFKVYCSSLIVSVSATMMIVASWLLGFYPIGIIHYGFNAEGLTASAIILTFLGYIAMIIAFTAVIHFICTLITKKALIIVSVILFVLIYTTFFQPMVLIYGYAEPTTWVQSSEVETEDGVVVTYVEDENPFYTEDGSPTKITARAVDTFVVPGQIVALSMFKEDIPPHFIFYDVFLIAFTVAVGNCIFAKKNLK